MPGYLRIALAESAPEAETDVAVFRMHCFWEGEAVLGALDGVVRTTSSWQGSAEVVAVTYLPAVIAKAKLIETAQARSCQPVGGDGLTPAQASDQQHAIGGTPYAALALTPMQRTKVHAALTLDGDARQWLTPAQRRRLATLEAEAEAEQAAKHAPPGSPRK